MASSALARGLLCCFLASLMASCAINPKTDDILDLDTALIKSAAHCEMRDAFADLLVSAVGRDGQAENVAAARSLSRTALDAYVPPSPDPAIAAEQKATHEASVFGEFLKTGYKQLKDDELAFVVNTYSQIYVGYRFEFDITRHDNVGASLSLVNAFTRGTFTAPIGGSLDGSRQAVNDTAQMDVVGELFTDEARIRLCNRIRNKKVSGTYAYPIAGELGLRKFAAEFIADNQSGNLIGQYSDADLLTSSDKPPRPSETWSLTFKTTLKGGVNDSVLKIEKLRSGTQVGGGGVNLSSERIDVHKLTVVMQLPPQKDGLTVAQRRNKAARDEAAAAIAKEFVRKDPTPILTTIQAQ